MTPADLIRMKGLPRLNELAGRSSDPRFYAMLQVLPNPDAILRRAGKTEEVFDAIISDAHVIGELRSIKADLQRFKHQLVPGGDRRVDKRAFELCMSVLDRDPAPMMTWSDVIWNIAQSTFRGLSVHELVWDHVGDALLPVALLDRPTRRFSFDGLGALRLLTREAPVYGVPAEEEYFLVDRHMPTYDNPYGVALLSSCFWPYTFKHGGFRWFVKFCERFGLPFPVGTYPVGSNEPSIKALEDALENLIEAGFAALEEGTTVELKESKGASSGGKLAQHQLIEVCNAEMSKALTSQTLATESNNSGSRAASQTHAERAGGVNEGDRERIANTLNKLWVMITAKNVGGDAKPPTSDFVGDQVATLDRAKVYEVFINSGGEPSRRAMAEDLGIELADKSDPEDVLAAAKPSAPTLMGVDGKPMTKAEFSRIQAQPFPDQTALDAAIDALDTADLATGFDAALTPILALLRTDPTAALGQMAEVYTGLDTDALVEKLSRITFAAEMIGQAQARSQV